MRELGVVFMEECAVAFIIKRNKFHGGYELHSRKLLVIDMCEIPSVKADVVVDIQYMYTGNDVEVKKSETTFYWFKLAN